MEAAVHCTIKKHDTKMLCLRKQKNTEMLSLRKHFKMFIKHHASGLVTFKFIS